MKVFSLSAKSSYDYAPTLVQRRALAKRFRRELKRLGITEVEKVPDTLLAGAKASYVGNVRIVVQYRIVHDDFIMRADVLGEPKS